MIYISLLAFISIMIGLIIYIQLSSKNEKDENFIDLRKVKKGDNIVLISGLHGIVDAIDDNVCNQRSSFTRRTFRSIKETN